MTFGFVLALLFLFGFVLLCAGFLLLFVGVAFLQLCGLLAFLTGLLVLGFSGLLMWQENRREERREAKMLTVESQVS